MSEIRTYLRLDDESIERFAVEVDEMNTVVVTIEMFERLLRRVGYSRDDNV